MAPGIVHDEQPALGGDDSTDLIDMLAEYAKSVPAADETGYAIPDTYLGSRRPVKVLIIGFGAAAINIVHAIGQNKGANIVLQCYEKNDQAGGTWYENK
jgi:hypothetical protein